MLSSSHIQDIWKCLHIVAAAQAELVEVDVFPPPAREVHRVVKAVDRATGSVHYVLKGPVVADSKGVNQAPYTILSS